jgi:hypothetical protein
MISAQDHMTFPALQHVLLLLPRPGGCQRRRPRLLLRTFQVSTQPWSHHSSRAVSKETWKLRALERILQNAPQPHPRQGTVLGVRVRGVGGCPYQNENTFENPRNFILDTPRFRWRRCGGTCIVRLLNYLHHTHTFKHFVFVSVFF